MTEAELFGFLEGTGDAAFSLTAAGEICSWNTSAEKMFGYPAAEVRRTNGYKLLKGRGVLGTSITSEPIDVRNAGVVPAIRDFDLEVTHSSGRRMWVNVSSLVFQDPRLHRYLLVHLARDISAQKGAEKLTKDHEALVHELIRVSKQLVDARGDGARPAPVGPLSEQELRILRQFAQCKKSEGIARQLRITLPTLRNHLNHINKKLRTHNRFEAVVHAIHRKLI